MPYQDEATGRPDGAPHDAHQRPVRRRDRLPGPALAVVLAIAVLVLGVALAGGLFDGAPGLDRDVAQGAGTPAGAAPTPGTPSAPPTARPEPRPTGGEVLVARVRSSRFDPSPGRIVPAPAAADDDVPRAYADGCQVLPPGTTPVRCVYGNPRARITVALVGDSKALQWLPALQEVARRQNWRIESYTKSACAFVRGVTTLLNGAPYTTCRTWNSRLAARLAHDPPEVVVTSNGKRSVMRTAASPGGSLALAPGLRAAWGALARSGSTVVVLRDTPDPGLDVPSCVAQHRADVRDCSFPRATGLRRSGGQAQLLALSQQPRATMIDLTPQLCPASPCQPVIGDLLVYRKGSHLTATFVRSMSGELERLLLRALR
ncbi:SGNH hydrolase domain-containing protein [Angustibacter sp. McL0619]|uniref:SGNH hydrolase domain-containing protein n=1 Tax=Angustibacter sp. McL0619 TaxID=3415676 RepID=UPI003CEC4769